MAGKARTTWGRGDFNVHTYADGHVEFRDYTNLADYSIRTLTAIALTDVGKYICSNVRAQLKKDYSKLKKARRRLWHSYQYWVRKYENDLIVGIKNPYLGRNAGSPGSSGKRNYDAWYNMGVEIGMQGPVKIPRKAYMQNFVYTNVDMIRRIEAQYLTAINLDNDELITYVNTAEHSVKIEGDGLVTDD